MKSLGRFPIFYVIPFLFQSSLLSFAAGIQKPGAPFPQTDPRARRCIELIRSRVDALWPGMAISELLNGTPNYKGQPYQSFQRRFDVELGTFVYESVLGQIPEESEIILPFFHGFGTLNFSYGGSTLQAMNVVMSWADSTKASSLFTAVQGLPGFAKAAAYAIDQPESGGGPLASRFPSLSPYIKWLASEFLKLKKLGLPIVPVCRSSSCGVIAELNLAYPGLLDGMIFTGPTHPSPSVGLNHSVAAVGKDIASGEYLPNERALHWINKLCGEMTWHKRERPFGNTPVLVLVGENDPESSPAGRAWFRKTVQKAGGKSSYFEIPGLDHDLFPTDRKEAVLLSYRHFYEFLDSLRPYRR